MSNKRTIFVVPGAGRVVPDPERGDTLPADGRNVPRTPYWLRAVNSGDVKEVKPGAEKTVSKKGESQ